MYTNSGSIVDSLRKSQSAAWRSMLNVINAISPLTAARLLYFRRTGKFLNVTTPRDFNEKLQWLKIYWHDPLVVVCADKYQLHGHVTRQGYGNILNPLLAVYDSPDEIVWDELPEKFVLKCTHGCGYNLIIRDKQELDPEVASQQLRRWMREKFGRKSLEPHYDRIIPRIILEAYIETRSGLLPWDYKVFCFNGVAKVVEVCSERERDLRVDFFDLDWNRLAISFETLQRPTRPERPDSLAEMVTCAETLARPFPFVRVDFYDNGGVPVLGELTFTPGSGMSTRLNDHGLRYLGDLLELPSLPCDDDPSSDRRAPSNSLGVDARASHVEPR